MTVITPEFRISFPHVFTPKQFKDEPPKYYMTMLFPFGKSDPKMAEMKAEAMRALVAKFGDDIPKLDHDPFVDQGDNAKYEGYVAGNVAVKASAKQEYKPGVVDGNVHPVIDPSQVYAGRWALAQVTAYAFKYGGKCGVAFGLNNVQLLRDDEPFGVTHRASDAFSPVAGVSAPLGNVNVDVKSTDDLFG